MNDAQRIESNCIMEFLRQVKMLKIEKPIAEYYFDPESKCRADRAFIKKRILIEFEGWGHRTKERFALDLHKYNRAAILGWRLIRFTPKMVFKGESIEVLRQAFFPPINYLSRCLVCLLEIDGSTIHTECFEEIYQRSDIDNEFLYKTAAKRESARELRNGGGTHRQVLRETRRRENCNAHSGA